MADDDSGSELSSLSSLSPAPSDDESDIQLKKEKGILKFFHKLRKGSTPTELQDEESPPPPKREPSPPHEYVLADNQDIAVSISTRCWARKSGVVTRHVACKHFLWSRLIPAPESSLSSCSETAWTTHSPKASQTLARRSLRAILSAVPLENAWSSSCALSWSCCWTGSKMSSKLTPTPERLPRHGKENSRKFAIGLDTITARSRRRFSNIKQTGLRSGTRAPLPEARHLLPWHQANVYGSSLSPFYAGHVTDYVFLPAAHNSTRSHSLDYVWRATCTWHHRPCIQGKATRCRRRYEYSSGCSALGLWQRQAPVLPHRGTRRHVFPCLSRE